MSWVLLACLSAALADPPPRPPAPTVVTGTVLPLAEVLKAKGLKFDAEPIARQVVLRQDDGTVTPLFSDDASRALFQDARLQNRRTEITGRRVEGFPYLQVLAYRIEEDGRLQTPEYFCDVCTISVRSPQPCPCCQGDMELRMKPERP